MTPPAVQCISAAAALLAVTGCAERQSSSNAAASTETPGIASLVADWTNWPVITPPNYKVSQNLLMLCIPTPAGDFVFGSYAPGGR